MIIKDDFSDQCCLFSLEVTVIIFVQWVVGIVGFRLTYKVNFLLLRHKSIIVGD